MFYSAEKVLIVLISLSMLTLTAYSHNNIGDIDKIIQEKSTALSQTKKSHTTQYMSLYDEIAELTISKNKLLIEQNRKEDIDTDKTCNLALEYGEVEFIKTQYYKTPFHGEVAKTLQNIASLFEQCHPPMAEKYLKSVLRIKEHIYLKESAEVADAHDALGDYYRIYMTNFQKAIDEYAAAKKTREKLYGILDPRITANDKRLAISLYYHGDKSGRAEKLLHDSITIRKNASPDKHFPLSAAYVDMGMYYSMKNEYSKSIEYLQNALKSFEGKVNSHYIDIVDKISKNYLYQDDFQNALKYGERALSISKELYGSETHPRVLEERGYVDDIRIDQRKANHRFPLRKMKKK